MRLSSLLLVLLLPLLGLPVAALAEPLPMSAPLVRVAIEGSVTDLEALLVERPSPLARTATGKTALHLAAEFNPDPRVSLRLLEAGWDREARDAQGRTPLLVAARRNTAPVVEALLRAGADAKVRDADGRTAADLSAGNRRLQALPVVRVLAEAVYR